MKNNIKIIVIIGLSALIVGVFLGALFFGGSGDSQNENAKNAESEKSAEVWTCSMHPSVRQNEPGDCPICGMDLIPVSESEGGIFSAEAVSMSTTARKLAGVNTLKVEAKPVEKNIELNGKISVDPRLNSAIAAHYPGRIEKLNVDFVGDYVRKGQVIAQVYSPELSTAQEELLEANKNKEGQSALFEAAKMKLKNWKLSDEQIDEIIKRGTVREVFQLRADKAGFVVEQKVNEGSYIQKGQVLFTINPLNRVWVLFDVYEEDLNYLNEGHSITYSVKAFPGQELKGNISYIDPVFNPKTEIVSARVNLSNSNLKFKPEMVVRGNYYYEDTTQNPIIIPSSAVLWTGKRSVVYVEENSENEVAYSMREVELGRKLSEGYEIIAGLNEGEEIAVKGAFSIDAAAQLAGKKSMMSASNTEKVELSANEKKLIRPLYKAYFELKDALTQDDFEQALRHAKTLEKEVEAFKPNQLNEAGSKVWKEEFNSLTKLANHLHHQSDIEELRKTFMGLSDAMIKITEIFDPISDAVYLQHCPMADNNEGADWLSLEDEVINPYFGSSMLRCGEVKKKF